MAILGDSFVQQFFFFIIAPKSWEGQVETFQKICVGTLRRFFFHFSSFLLNPAWVFISPFCIAFGWSGRHSFAILLLRFMWGLPMRLKDFMKWLFGHTLGISAWLCQGLWTGEPFWIKKKSQFRLVVFHLIKSYIGKSTVFIFLLLSDELMSAV